MKKKSTKTIIIADTGSRLQEYQDNFNESSVSYPPDFVGMGNNTRGRNYSPAWGGQFMSGGSLPGTVGFTYARTGSTPSNGKHAKKTLPSAEYGMSFYQNGLDFNPKMISENGMTIQDMGQLRKLNQLINFTNYNEPQPGGFINNNTMKSKKQKSRRAVNGTPVEKTGFDFNTLADPISGVAQGVMSLIEENKKRKDMERWGRVSDVVVEASRTRPEPIQRRYLRPEDNVNTGEEFFPIYGVGTNVLAKRGISLKGNPSEIQNIYSPGTLYNDLGYEPLNDSEKVKAYKRGGKIAENGFGKFMTSGGSNIMTNIESSLFGDNAGFQLGKSIGDTLSIIPGVGPVAGAIASPVLGAIGGLLDPNPKKIKRAQQKIEKNIGNVAFSQGVNNFQNENSSYMENGGKTSSYEWMSHTWQPQVITKFGEHRLSDLLKPDKSMDTLRAGGHLKEYTEPSNRALQTYAMGGELETHWGGYAEPISENRFLPDGGETVMFRGQSHDDSDGRGRTGIGITYGNSPVEVERGEPAVKLQDGGNSDSLVVFGNLPIAKEFVPILGDPDAKGKKFKNYVAELSKKEDRANKIIDKSVAELDDLQVITPFDKLKFSGLSANVKGGNMKLKDIAEKKENAALLQSAINDTAEKYELVPDDLALGKVKKAKYGTKVAEGGITTDPAIYDNLTNLYNLAKKAGKGPAVQKFQKEYYKVFPEEAEQIIRTSPVSNVGMKQGVTEQMLKDPNFSREKLFATNDDIFGPRTEQFYAKLKRGDLPVGNTQMVNVPQIDYFEDPSLSPLNDPISVTDEPINRKRKFDLLNLLSKGMPYLRPSDAEGLDPRQLSGEMFALASNQLEPVWSQTVQPDLTVPYDISYQEMLDENQADYRAAQRMVANNPAALAVLNAQKYKANQKILAEQFRANQAEKARVYEKNRDIMTTSKLQNLGILDKQYERQQTAKANTKATTQAVLNSISDKFMKNKLENRTLRTYENLYNYRYDNQGRLINMNAPVEFNLPINVGQDVNAIQPVSKTPVKKTTGRNGSIVSAMKNF